MVDRLIERSHANAVRTSRWMDADERALLKFLSAAAQAEDSRAA